MYLGLIFFPQRHLSRINKLVLVLFWDLLLRWAISNSHATCTCYPWCASCIGKLLQQGKALLYIFSFSKKNNLKINQLTFNHVHADDIIILPLSLYFTVHICTHRLTFTKRTMSTGPFTKNFCLWPEQKGQSLRRYIWHCFIKRQKCNNLQQHQSSSRYTMATGRM